MQQIVKIFRENPLAWGMQYFGHHFRGPSPPFHLNIVLEAMKNDLLAIASPRESAKSTIVTFLLPTHAIAFKQAHFIVIIQSTYAKAAGSLETIKREFKENQDLIKDHKVVIRKDAEGDTIFRHPCGHEIQVLCAGREQIGALRGRKFGAYRPDLIIIDDVEDDEMVRNPDRRRELQSLFDEVVMLLGERNHVKVLMIGTVLHDDSQIAKMISKKEYPKFRKLLYRGWNKMPDGKVRSLWDYKWTVADLEEMMRHNPTKFAKEIQNDPTTGLLQDISQEDFRYWYQEEGKAILFGESNQVIERYELHQCKAAVAIDLAWEEKRQDDETVIMPAYLTPSSDLLIDDYINKRGMRPNEIYEILFTMDTRYRSITRHPVPFGFEKAKLEKVIKHLLKLEMKKRNQFLWFRDLAWDKDKIERIVTRLQPRYKQHVIYHKKGMGDLERQLVRVRSAAHDDLADCCQSLVQLLEYPKKQKVEEKTDDMFERVRQQTIKSRKPKKGRYVFGMKNKNFEVPHVQSIW